MWADASYSLFYLTEVTALGLLCLVVYHTYPRDILDMIYIGSSIMKGISYSFLSCSEISTNCQYSRLSVSLKKRPCSTWLSHLTFSLTKSVKTAFWWHWMGQLIPVSDHFTAMYKRIWNYREIYLQTLEGRNYLIPVTSLFTSLVAPRSLLQQYQPSPSPHFPFASAVSSFPSHCV